MRLSLFPLTNGLLPMPPLPPPDSASLDDIRAVCVHFPDPDAQARHATRQREDQLTKPPGSLGRLEDIAAWLAAWQGRHPPRLGRVRVSLFAGNHGVAARGVSAYPASVTRQMVANFRAGGAAINQLCKAAGAELMVYELDLDHPTEDMTSAPAMSPAACAQAMAYGMAAVEEGIDLLVLGELGIGNTAVAAALALGLFGGEAADWTGPGTGVQGEALAHKRAVVAEAVARHRPTLEAAGQDPLVILQHLGGFELAAMAGAVMAARMGRIPVLLDGFVCTAAAAVVARLAPGGLDHCLLGHLSPEPGHRRLAETLGLEPLLNLGMRLGEGSGAAAAIGIIRAAHACHTGMATFAEAGVSGPA